jgi:PHD/YefM family antitoxin component YafN of YafNO toxin-antitoxin module
MIVDINVKEDIIDLETMGQNLAQIVSEVSEDHASKIIIQDNKPAAILMNVSDFQEMQDRIQAMELYLAMFDTMQEHEHGETIELDDLAAEFGVKLSENYSKPGGYDALIPEVYRNVS